MTGQSDHIKNGVGSKESEITLSIITPAYNEAENLPQLYQRLKNVISGTGLTWEWIIVDDHSTDNTFSQITKLRDSDSRIMGLRFARNFGSHIAIFCGLEHAKGKCAVVLAADLQDPPESIPILLNEWKQGYRVVWAARGNRLGVKKRDILFSKLFFFMMRSIIGIKNMPATGADFFLIDKKVISSLLGFGERNLSIAALINWMGFQQTTVNYDKQARIHGSSGWSWQKKIKIILDSITSFSFFPIRVMSVAGFCISIVGFLYAGVVIWNALSGNPPQGWASLMIVILIVGGFQMLMLGILGEYLWRALDESRRRPKYLIEETTES
jgi:glycosyltransferase involved in cell wall biosynthesis